MRQRALPAAALLLLLLALPAAGQSGSVLSPVAAGDPLAERALVPFTAGLGYFDADNDGRADGAEPAEPAYFDLDASRTVSYGDVRMTPFGRYPAGTTVDVGNTDVGRSLAVPTGWLASSAAGAWYADLDGSRTASDGDVRLGAAFGSRVAAQDPDARADLQPAQTQVAPSQRVSHVPLQPGGGRRVGDPVYFDLDPTGTPGAGRVTAGDLRLAPTGPGSDAAASATGATSGPGGATPAATSGAGGVQVVERGGDGGPGWRGADTFLLLLGLVNLAGLAYVARALRGRPRNPFK